MTDGERSPVNVKATIPLVVLMQLQCRRVLEAGFGAGPSFCAGKVEKFDPPGCLDDGLAWIQRYFHVMRRGSLFLDDRTVLYFESPFGYLRYDPVPRQVGPSPGVTRVEPPRRKRKAKPLT